MWLSSASTSATIRGVAISAHGDYQKESAPPLDGKPSLPPPYYSRFRKGKKGDADLGTGTRPKIGYISYYPVNHQLIATDDKGGEQPLIAWESMTAAARTAIENTDFGDATPSFRDSNFQSYLADAFI